MAKKAAKHSDAVMTGILVTRFKMGQIDCQGPGGECGGRVQGREVLGCEKGAGVWRDDADYGH